MMDGKEVGDNSYDRNVPILDYNVNSGFCECNGVGKFSRVGNSTFKKWAKMEYEYLKQRVPEGPNPLTNILLNGGVCQCAMGRWQVYLENQTKKRLKRADLCVKHELTAYEASAGSGSKNINTVDKLVNELDTNVNIVSKHPKPTLPQNDVHKPAPADRSTDVKNVNKDKNKNKNKEEGSSCDLNSGSSVPPKGPNLDIELELFEQVLSDHLRKCNEVSSIEEFDDTFGTWHDMLLEDEDTHLEVTEVYCPIRASTERSWSRWALESARSFYRNISFGLVDIQPDTYRKGLLFMEDCKFNFRLFDMEDENRSSNYAFQKALRDYFKIYGYDSFVQVTIYKKYLQPLIVLKSRTVLSEQSYKVFVDKLFEMYHGDKLNKDREPELQMIYNTAFVAIAHLQMYEFQNNLMGVVKRDIPDKIFKRT